MALQTLLHPRHLSQDASILLTLLLVSSIHVFLGSLRYHILHFRGLNNSDVCLWHPICLNMAGIFLSPFSVTSVRVCKAEIRLSGALYSGKIALTAHFPFESFAICTCTSDIADPQSKDTHGGSTHCALPVWLFVMFCFTLVRHTSQ